MKQIFLTLLVLIIAIVGVGLLIRHFTKDPEPQPAPVVPNKVIIPPVQYDDYGCDEPEAICKG